MTERTAAQTSPVELSDAARAFQLEVREWLAANAPEELVGVSIPRRRTGDVKLALDRWAERLGEHGYLCVAWPVEYGGRGLTGVEVALLNEEFHRARVPRITRAMGESLVGPSIIAHGTEDQKSQFLPQDHRRHRPLLPGLLRARRRLGPCEPAHQGRARRRRDHRQRPEGVDLVVLGRDDAVLPVPNRPGGAQAPGHLLRPDPDRARWRAQRRRVSPDQADDRRGALRRDVHQRRPCAAVQHHRRAQQRLEGRDDDARQ